MLPYDRPKLSKNLEIQADAALLRAEDWYTASNVEVMLGTTVTKLDTAQKRAELDNGNCKNNINLIEKSRISKSSAFLFCVDLTLILHLCSAILYNEVIVCSGAR